MIEDIALFYSIGAIVTGLWFASYKEVEGTWQGKPLPFPRLMGGIIVGLLWPWSLVQYIWQAKDHGQ